MLVEPQVPRPLLVIVGDSKAAITLADLARAIDWRVTTELTGEADAVVVATMGHADEEALGGARRRAGTSGSWPAPGAPASCSAPCGSAGRRGAAGARAQPCRARPRAGDAAGDRRRDPGGARGLAAHPSRRMRAVLLEAIRSAA